MNSTPLELTGLKPHPFALILTDLGPTNRDSNASGLRNDALKLLAEELRYYGIGSPQLKQTRCRRRENMTTTSHTRQFGNRPSLQPANPIRSTTVRPNPEWCHLQRSQTAYDVRHCPDNRCVSDENGSTGS